MPPLNVLFLTILGGFIFVTQWYPTKYYTLRSDGYRLIFTASLAGAVFLLLASLLSFCLQTLSSTAQTAQWTRDVWHQIAPLPHSGKATIALLMGTVLWAPLNFLGQWVLCLSDLEAIDRAIKRKRDPLEMFLRRALSSGRLISLTLKNGKVYVGKLQSNFNPAFPMETIGLFLSRSGYRDKDTKEITLNIDYDQTHKEIKGRLAQKIKDEINRALEENPDLNDEELEVIARTKIREQADVEVFLNWEIILPVGEIQSVNMFDPDIYDEHFKQRSQIEEKATEQKFP